MRLPLSGLLFSSLLLGGGVLAACGGGSGGGATGANGFTPSTPTPCPAGYTGSAPACTAVQQSGGFTPVSSATSIPLPAIAGYSGTVSIPAASLPGPVQITTSATNPGVPTLALRARSAMRVRATAAQVDTPLLYITFTATSGSVIFTGFPGFTIDVPSGVNGPFYLAELENGTWTTVAGPSNANPTTLQSNLPAFSINANSSVYFLLYTGGVVPSTAPSASPGGAPTSTASSGPTPTASSNPTSGATATSSPTPIGTGATPSPLPSASTSPTIPPTIPPTTTPTATPFPTTSPQPTPTAGSGVSQTPKTLSIGALPSGQAGTAMSFASGIFTVTAKNALPTPAPISGSFANPVTVTSSDATGAVQLSLNGGAAGPTATLSSSSDLVGIVYSGATVNPVTITASASTVSTNATATFTPAIQPVVYSGPMSKAGAPEIDLYSTSGAGSSYTFTATQAGFTSPFTNNITVSGQSACSSFANISPSSGTSFTVSSVTPSPTNGSCTVTLTGFSAASAITLKITYTAFGVILQ